VKDMANSNCFAPHLGHSTPSLDCSEAEMINGAMLFQWLNSLPAPEIAIVEV
jgi:hypothetical protein